MQLFCRWSVWMGAKLFFFVIWVLALVVWLPQLRIFLQEPENQSCMNLKISSWRLHQIIVGGWWTAAAACAVSRLVQSWMIVALLLSRNSALPLHVLSVLTVVVSSLIHASNAADIYEYKYYTNTRVWFYNVRMYISNFFLLMSIEIIYDHSSIIF